MIRFSRCIFHEIGATQDTSSPFSVLTTYNFLHNGYIYHY